MDDRRDDWQALWDKRLAALEAQFGAADDVVGHAAVPLRLGAEAGGAADVLYFRSWTRGRLSVTAELLGFDDQPANVQGQYELAVCHRDDEGWGPNLISLLANYTFDCALEPGETMGIESAVPDGADVVALLFCDLARFEFGGAPAGVLLCIGITREELDACHADRGDEVLAALKASGVYPYTDLRRRSVVSAAGIRQAPW